MHPESNALGLIAGGIWWVCGLYVLACARRAEASARVLLGFGLVAAGAMALLLVSSGGVDWLGGGVLIVLSMLTLLIIVTRSGRRQVGLDDWGITTHVDQLGDADSAHKHGGAR